MHPTVMHSCLCVGVEAAEEDVGAVAGGPHPTVMHSCLHVGVGTAEEGVGAPAHLHGQAVRILL